LLEFRPRRTGAPPEAGTDRFRHARSFGTERQHSALARLRHEPGLNRPVAAAVRRLGSEHARRGYTAPLPPDDRGCDDVPDTIDGLEQ
jgi:hypothetical protein